MRISDWSPDVCSSDLPPEKAAAPGASGARRFSRLFIHFGLGRALGLGLLAGLLVVQAWDPPPLRTLRLKTFDLYQTLKPRQAQPQPIIVVDIDDETLARSEEHTSELQSLMRISYAVFCLQKKNKKQQQQRNI